MLLIFAIVVIIIVGGLIVSSMHGAQQSASFQRTNAMVPTQFSSLANSSQSTDALKVISTLAIAGVQNASEFSISYSGNLAIKPSGVLGAALNINSPLYIQYYKYNKAAKLNVSVSSVSVFGHAQVTYVNTTSGSAYVCSNLNTTAIQKLNPSKILVGAITCANATSLLGVNLQEVSKFNVSSAIGGQVQTSNYSSGIQFRPNNVYESTYRGEACTFIAGNVLYTAQNGTITNEGAFQMCVSNQYYVPLSLSVNTQSSQASMSVAINETNMTSATNPSQINSLPGPTS